MKRVLITGSGGFVFTNFIRKALFNKSEYTFVSVDACRDNNVLNNIYANKGHKFHVGSVTDKHFLNVLFELEQPDIIIHGADISLGSSEEMINTNILGTQILLEVCARRKIERFIYISTEQVYGPAEKGSCKEDDPPNPVTVYASTKLSGELLVKNFGLPYDIVRLGYCYGPRQMVCHFIPKVIQNVLKNKESVLLENPNRSRELTYVEDVYSGISTLLNKQPENQITNLSSGFEFSYLEISQEICNTLGRGYELIKFVEPGLDQEVRYSSDVSKLKTLGWKPSFKFRNGLYHTCSWYERNPWFLRTD